MLCESLTFRFWGSLESLHLGDFVYPKAFFGNRRAFRRTGMLFYMGKAQSERSGGTIRDIGRRHVERNNIDEVVFFGMANRKYVTTARTFETPRITT